MHAWPAITPIRHLPCQQDGSHACTADEKAAREQKKAPAVAAKAPVAAPDKKKVDVAKINALQSAGGELGAEAQNRKNFMLGLKKGPPSAATDAPPQSSSSAMTASTSSPRVTMEPTPVRAAPQSTHASSSSNMTFSFSFSGTPMTSETTTEPEPTPAPVRVIAAPVITAASGVSDEDQARVERAQRMREETARMLREQAEEEAKLAPASSYSSSSMEAPSSKSTGAAISLDNAVVAGLANRLKVVRHVTVYIVAAEGTTNERDVFINKYVPLLRTLCQPSDVQLTVTQHASAAESLGKLHGTGALEASLCEVDQADIVVAFFGRSTGSSVDAELLDEVLLL